MKITIKLLSVILIISLLFVVLQTSVLASNDNLVFQQIQEALGENTNSTNPVNVNNTVAPTNTNNTSATNETLPKTGITEDYAIIAFAVICGISAIYAYKKVKNYNIK